MIFAAIVIIEYPAIYTALLAVSRYQVLAKSVEDVAANPNIQVFTYQGFAAAPYVLVHIPKRYCMIII